MLILFNNTKFLAGISLVIYLIITRIYGFLHPIPIVEEGGVLYKAFIQLFQGNTLMSAVMAAVVSFLNAILINRILFHRRVSTHRDYFAALIYVLLSGSLLAFQTLTPFLLGSVFILLAINKLYELSKESEKRETDYYVGLLIGLAGLISPFYFIFIVPALVSMFLFGAFRLNEVLSMLLGWINLVLLAGAYFFLIDGLDYFLEHTFTFHYAAYLFFSNWTWGTYGLLLLYLILSVAAVLIQPILITKKQHHTKQFIRVVYNFLFTAIGSVLFMDVSIHHVLFILVLFLAIIFGMYYKRKNGMTSWTLEILHFAFFLFVMFNHFGFQLG